MSKIKADNRKVSRSFAVSRGMLVLLILSLVLWNAPAQSGKTIRGFPPEGIDNSGPGFLGTNHYPFLTANVLSNDTDIYNRPLIVTGFDASGAKGQVSLVDPWPNSSLDTTFGIGGKVSTGIGWEIGLRDIALQADGKIVSAGTIQTELKGGHSFAVARFTADGKLDSSFNGTGWVTPKFNIGNQVLSAELIQPDGKIVVVGEASPYFGLARINLDGSMDTTFGGNGYVTTTFGGSEAVASSVAIQPDHKILVSGYTKGGPPETPIIDFALARFNPNGSLDTSFDKDGKVTTDFGGDDLYPTVLVQTDGKIILVGQATSSTNPYDYHIAAARYNPNGSLDSSFGSGGRIATILPHTLQTIRAVLQPDGKILVAGGNHFDNLIVLVRYNPDGSLDAGFNADVINAISFASVALQPDGKIVLTGTIYTPDNWDYWLRRLNSDGSLDTAFGVQGTVVIAFDAPDSNGPGAVALQKDGKIIVGGITPSSGGLRNNDICVVRVNKDGLYQLRNSFRYDPNGQFNWLSHGETAFDTFAYTVSNGGQVDTATVTVTISAGIETNLPLISR
jgi:uncharacterized delta-60 repeat protein